jgi:hypothetical protein
MTSTELENARHWLVLQDRFDMIGGRQGSDARGRALNNYCSQGGGLRQSSTVKALQDPINVVHNLRSTLLDSADFGSSMFLIGATLGWARTRWTSLEHNNSPKPLFGVQLGETRR